MQLQIRGHKFDQYPISFIYLFFILDPLTEKLIKDLLLQFFLNAEVDNTRAFVECLKLTAHLEELIRKYGELQEGTYLENEQIIMNKLVSQWVRKKNTKMTSVETFIEMLECFIKTDNIQFKRGRIYETVEWEIRKKPTIAGEALVAVIELIMKYNEYAPIFSKVEIKVMVDRIASFFEKKKKYNSIKDLIKVLATKSSTSEMASIIEKRYQLIIYSKYARLRIKL